jgi:threonine/homoserine/homoserine lactone efflux protein
MEFIVFIKGLLIGISIAAPVGPIGLLCIRRTLAQGRIYGFVSGLGAASADTVYGIIAGFGLNFIINFLTGHQFWFQLCGGLFLFYLGTRIFISKASETPAEAKGSHLIGAYLSVLFLTLTNPITILSFMGIFAGLGLSQNNTITALTLVLGVFVGSVVWWILLSSGVGLFKHRINKKALAIVNRFSGGIILIIGGLNIYGLLK